MTANMILLSDFTDPRFRAAFQAYFAELGIPVRDWDGLFREMNEEGNNLAWLLPDEGGGSAGFLMFQMTGFSNWFFEEPFGFIREFWVAPAYRRRGLGKALLRRTEDYFAEHGAYRAVLTADDAVAFYLANGYTKSPGVKAKNQMEVLSKSLRDHDGNMAPTIRAYEQTDWTAIEKIHDSARRMELELAGLEEAFLPLKTAAEREGLLEYPGLFVAELGREVVGFAACTEEELAWLYVDPSHMRKGIGRSLSASALERFPGIRYIEALKGNEPARKLYESLGFTVTGIETGKMPGNESFTVEVYSMERK